MQTKTILAAAFAIPLLVLACNREDKSQTATAPNLPKQEKQAQAPSSPDRMLESAPPAAGAPSSTDKSANPSSPPAASGDTGSQQKTEEPKKGAAY